MILDPDFPHIVLSFRYRGWQLELDQSEVDGDTVYAVWANHAQGYAIAVPCALTRAEAIRRAKRYVDTRCQQCPPFSLGMGH